MAICIILWPFGIFYDHLAHCVIIWYIFSGFCVIHQEKSGNPGLDWCAMATISTRDSIRGSPFANVFSVSDGTSLKVGRAF
jgi:hypothetical protein